MRTLVATLLLLPALALARPVASGRVVDGLTGAPIPDATVSLIGTLHHGATDAAGRFAFRGAEGFEWVAIDAEGYGARETRLGVDARLWPLHVDDAEVEAWFEARDRPAMDSDDLGDPDLTDAARAWIAAARGLPGAEPPPTVGRFKVGELTPPATIRIYRRGPENNSCQGRVDVIPLEEYVRGVVPHEWIPSWHQESLNAGAVAARGYGWGWILRGGKYDCADLDDTTRSQVYRDDRDARGDAAVENTRGQGIHRDGEFLASEYSAENGDPTDFGVAEPLCSGRARNGHGRGMCQWGTQRWATQRDQNYVWMVEHYFPGATVSSPEAPRPNLTLRQALARVDPQPCADPAGTYDCADFVPDGRSAGLFDLYVGQRVDLTVEIANEGAAPAPANTTLAVTLPAGLLALDATEAPGAVGGADPVTIEVGPIGPGERRSVRLTLRGAGYSVPTGQPARVRSWVRRAGDIYDKPTWDAAPAVNEGQTFNGGDLRTQAELDVFDPAGWTFEGGDAALVEGWRGVRDVSALTVDGGALRVAGAGAAPTLDGPWAPLDADAYGAVEVALDPARRARLYWRAAGEDFADARSAEVVDGRAEVAGAPGWRGPLQQLRLAIDGAGETRIDAIRLVAAAPPLVPDADVPPAPANDAGPPPAPIDDLGAPFQPPPVDARVPSPARDAGPGGAFDDAFVPRAPGANSRATGVSSDGGCDTSGDGPAPLWLMLLLIAPATRRRR